MSLVPTKPSPGSLDVIGTARGSGGVPTANASLAERLAAVERRLAILENQRAAAASGALDAESSRAFETNLGLTWLNRAGAAVLVTAVVLAASWAYDQGYLTPALRNGLLGALSLGLLTAGARAMTLGTERIAQAGIGIAVVGATGAMTTLYSLAHFDALVAPALAAAGGLVIALALVGFGLAANREAAATLGLVCLYGLPVIAGRADASAWLAAVAIAIVGALLLRRARAWPRVSLVAAVAGAGYALAVSPPAHAVAVGAALFCIAQADRALHRRATHPSDRVALLIAIATATIALWRAGDPVAAVVAGAMLLVVGAMLEDVALIAVSLIAAGVGAFALGNAAGQTAALSATGVALVLAGARYADSSVRLLGIAWLVAAIGKLVALDLWDAAVGLRIGALALVGVALMAASVIYSRLAD